MSALNVFTKDFAIFRASVVLIFHWIWTNMTNNLSQRRKRSDS